MAHFSMYVSFKIQRFTQYKSPSVRSGGSISVRLSVVVAVPGYANPPERAVSPCPRVRGSAAARGPARPMPGTAAVAGRGQALCNTFEYSVTDTRILPLYSHDPALYLTFGPDSTEL